MLQFTLGHRDGKFEDGVLVLKEGGDGLHLQATLQAMIDYDIAHHTGYMPGPDASARRVLIEMGATITEEAAEHQAGVVY